MKYVNQSNIAEKWKHTANNIMIENLKIFLVIINGTPIKYKPIATPILICVISWSKKKLEQYISKDRKIRGVNLIMAIPLKVTPKIAYTRNAQITFMPRNLMKAGIKL